METGQGFSRTRVNLYLHFFASLVLKSVKGKIGERAFSDLESNFKVSRILLPICDIINKVASIVFNGNI